MRGHWPRRLIGEGHSGHGRCRHRHIHRRSPKNQGRLVLMHVPLAVPRPHRRRPPTTSILFMRLSNAKEQNAPNAPLDKLCYIAYELIDT